MKRTLHVFDLDDTIFYGDAKVLSIDKESKKFVAENAPNSFKDDIFSYYQFRDYAGDSTFLKECRRAVTSGSVWRAKYWNTFVAKAQQALESSKSINNELVSIVLITNRGHSIQGIRMGLRSLLREDGLFEEDIKFLSDVLLEILPVHDFFIVGWMASTFGFVPYAERKRACLDLYLGEQGDFDMIHVYEDGMMYHKPYSDLLMEKKVDFEIHM